jgi:Ser/Thr protein kinase RdoA (MazF antagonist)
LKNFDHRAARRSHQWSLMHAARHRAKTDLIESSDKRALVTWAFDILRQSERRLHALPHQFIHGDANPENILVRGDQVIGLVDFGDSCLNPMICDLAICVTYLMMNRDKDSLSIRKMQTGSSVWSQPRHFSRY